MSPPQKVGLTAYFLVLGLLLIVGVIAVGWGGVSLGSAEVRLAAIAALAGGLGALVQSVGSFITYAGERKLYTSWVWWYVLRPLSGSGLALVFYFAFRGGLLVISTSQDVLKPESINLFGVGGIAGLVGMFSKEATDKLKEIAEALFKKQERADSMEKPKTPPPAGGGQAGGTQPPPSGGGAKGA
jgi:hypothetical protein